MSFIGLMIFVHIDACLWEAFPKNKDSPFGGRSIILMGDMGKLPPVKDKPCMQE